MTELRFSGGAVMRGLASTKIALPGLPHHAGPPDKLEFRRL